MVKTTVEAVMLFTLAKKCPAKRGVLAGANVRGKSSAPTAARLYNPVWLLQPAAIGGAESPRREDPADRIITGRLAQISGR